MAKQTSDDRRKTDQHNFIPDNIGENEPPSRFCKVCGEYLTDEKHKRELH